MAYKIINGKLYPIDNIYEVYKKENDSIRQKSNNNDFKNILDKKLKNESFTLSKHAFERLRERRISFNNDDMKKINKAINEAEKKGCKECLIFYKDTALITSIKNRTIITALDNKKDEINLITNIDSVALLK